MEKISVEQLRNNVFNGYPISIEVEIKGMGKINREQLNDYLKSGQIFVLDNDYIIDNSEIKNYMSEEGTIETAKVKMVATIK